MAPAFHLGDPLVQERDLVEQRLGDHPVMAAEHAVQRLGEGVPLAAQRPFGQVRDLARVAFAAISACTITTADLAFIPSATTEVILTMASSSSFSSRCRHRVRSRTRLVRARVTTLNSCCRPRHSSGQQMERQSRLLGGGTRHISFDSPDG